MFIIGIGGGTGSGKTTVAQKIAQYIGEDICSVVPLDNYYKDMSHVPFGKRKEYNYDHPDMIEHRLLLDHIKQLKEGSPIHMPEYNFSTYTRTGKTITILPRPVIIVEGIFTLYYNDLRDMYDLAVFVDTEADVRLIRRLERDIKERERTLDSVIRQYLDTVKPMHDAYVEPSKRFADIIIPKGGFNEKAIRVIVEYIFRELNNR